jgi:hypothetical protein
MKRHLLAAAACLLVATLGHHAQAFETGGEQLAPEINISPMTAALVQAAQARVFAGSPALQQQQLQQQQLQQQQLAGATAGGSTGNPSTDRLLGIPANPGGATRALVNQQLLARAQSFTRPSAGFGAGGGDFGAGGGDPGGLVVGGVPVVNNITNVTNQSGVFNTATANTTIVGNGNTAIQKIGAVGNGVHAAGQ